MSFPTCGISDVDFMESTQEKHGTSVARFFYDCRFLMHAHHVLFGEDHAPLSSRVFLMPSVKPKSGTLGIPQPRIVFEPGLRTLELWL